MPLDHSGELQENSLNQNYWNERYLTNSIAWDIGQVSPPIKNYLDTLKDKNCKILIPGCGNTYEAAYLLEKGFTNITVIDIAPTLVENLSRKFNNNPNIKIILGDFFDHMGAYDLIIEQTFFCALPLSMRQRYVWKMHQLLAQEGKIAGLLFNKTFEISPPFGGNQSEYLNLFKGSFECLKMKPAMDSIPQRANSELTFELKKNHEVKVNIYAVEGIKNNQNKEHVMQLLSHLPTVLNVSISSNYKIILIVSAHCIEIETLKKQLLSIHISKLY